MCCPQFSLNLEVELDNDPGTFGGSTTNRKCTDVLGLIIMVLFFGAVIGLSAYCISNSEVKILINGYDNYGNICGKNNNKIDSILLDGFGKNMQQMKYVLIREDAVFGTTKECVENCTMRGTTLLYNYCVTDRKFLPFFIEMKQYVLFYFIALFIIALSIIFMNIYSFNQINFFKLPIYFIVLVFPAGILILFLMEVFDVYLKKKNYYMLIIIIIGIVLLILTVLNVPLLFYNKLKLERHLTYQLYEEVFKATNPMTFCLLPLLSTIVISGSVISVIYYWVWFQSFSYPDQINIENESRIIYAQYPISTVTGVLVIYAVYLLYEFVRNCQCMIVGGYVAQRYFATSDGVDSDLFNRSIANLLKYHLGTVCCGSVLLPFVYALRALVNGVTGAASGYNSETVCTCSCRLLSVSCLAPVKTCLDYFSQNAFIMTAMNGCSFCAGTIRAHKLISHNSFNLPSIMKFQYYVLETLKFLYSFWAVNLYCFVITVSHYTCMKFLHNFYFVFLYILVDCFISVLKVTSDTIFLCFCEDYLYNNGTSKPYKMSKNLAQFIESANQYVDPVKWKDIADKWEKGPGRLN